MTYSFPIETFMRGKRLLGFTLLALLLVAAGATAAWRVRGHAANGSAASSGGSSGTRSGSLARSCRRFWRAEEEYYLARFQAQMLEQQAAGSGASGAAPIAGGDPAQVLVGLGGMAGP
jgi:hypothetical protein